MCQPKVIPVTDKIEIGDYFVRKIRVSFLIKEKILYLFCAENCSGSSCRISLAGGELVFVFGRSDSCGYTGQIPILRMDWNFSRGLWWSRLHDPTIRRWNQVAS